MIVSPELASVMASRRVQLSVSQPLLSLSSVVSTVRSAAWAMGSGLVVSATAVSRVTPRLNSKLSNKRLVRIAILLLQIR